MANRPSAEALKCELCAAFFAMPSQVLSYCNWDSSDSNQELFVSFIRVAVSISFGPRARRNSVFQRRHCCPSEQLLAQGLTQEMCNTMAQKKLFYSPTILEYIQPSIEDTDAKNIGGKYGIVPIFKKNVRMCIATKGIVTVFGSGSQGAAWREGSNALEFAALVEIGGMTPAGALQAGTINAATEMRWQNDIGSITKGKFADIVASPAIHWPISARPRE